MGSVIKRGKYWYIGYYADGKRHRISHGKLKKFAELRLKEIELQIEREELRISKDSAIDEFFENFLIYAEAHVSPHFCWLPYHERRRPGDGEGTSWA